MNGRMQRAAICGLFCDSCGLYIGTKEEPERLTRLAAKYGKTVEDVTCEGCRSEVLSFYCKDCGIKRCALEKGIAFCSECDDYPCAELEAFKRLLPHRNDIYKSLDHIATDGVESWLERMDSDHGCAACGTLNSPYDILCRKCGHTPPSGYHERHKEAIMEVIGQNGRGK